MSLDHNINENGENCLNANFRVRYSCLQCEEGAIGSHCQKHETEGEEKWCFGVWEQKVENQDWQNLDAVAEKSTHVRIGRKRWKGKK